MEKIFRLSKDSSQQLVSKISLNCVLDLTLS